MDDEHENHGCIIRQLTAEDLKDLVRMDQKITGRTRRKWYEGKLHRALAESDLQVSLGAELDGRLVGAMLGSVHYGEFGLPEPVAVLDTALVDLEHRGKGVGNAMFEQLVRNLRALRIEKIRTEVAWNEQELLAFFGKKGLSPIPRLVLEADLTEIST
jgi:ribosomal protein S18 acetylase RimI-like enzyme